MLSMFCIVGEKSTAGCEAHSMPTFKHTILSGLQRGDGGGRKGVTFLQFYPWSRPFQTGGIPGCSKAATFGESCPSTAPFGGNHPHAQTPPKGLWALGSSSAPGLVQREINRSMSWEEINPCVLNISKLWGEPWCAFISQWSLFLSSVQIKPTFPCRDQEL